MTAWDFAASVKVDHDEINKTAQNFINESTNWENQQGLY